VIHVDITPYGVTLCKSFFRAVTEIWLHEIGE
jgi:hypothetical protein